MPAACSRRLRSCMAARSAASRSVPSGIPTYRGATTMETRLPIAPDWSWPRTLTGHRASSWRPSGSPPWRATYPAGPPAGTGRARAVNGCVQHLDELHARHAVDHGVVQLEEDDRPATGVAVEDREVPQRAVTLEETAVELAAHPGQHPVVAGGGECLLVDVVGDVEIRVVLPGGVGDAERRGHDLLPVPGQEVHAVADH